MCPQVAAARAGGCGPVRDALGGGGHAPPHVCGPAAQDGESGRLCVGLGLGVRIGTGREGAREQIGVWAGDFGQE